ncbi:recombinase family protein [Clostridium sp.]|uniref:recombinase family protein n=1 Tax=Clostridium sp. TaxID=1506 RepID=UPI0037BE8391
MSENSTWGIRRKFEQGKVVVNYNKFLGYDKDEEGNLIINEKQAKIVRRIDGKSKWYESSIRKMLSNEKYKGDALLQKTYRWISLQRKGWRIMVRFLNTM